MGAFIAIAFVGLFILIAMGRLALINRRWRRPQIPRNGIGGFWPIFPVGSNMDNSPSPDGREPPHHHHHHHDGGMPADGGHHGHHGGFDGGHHHGGGFDGGGHSHSGGGFDGGGGGGHGH